MIYQRPFGVEIELNGSGYKDYGDIIRLTNQSGNYFEFAIPMGWKFHEDESCGLEFASPPTTNDVVIASMVDKLLDICTPREDGKYLEKNFNKTGIHIHVGISDLNKEQALRIGKFCRFFDRAIFALISPNRIANKYCRMLSCSNDGIEKLTNPKSRWDRYYGCNLAAMAKHGTVEYRYPRGTLRKDRILAYIEFFQRVTDLGISFMGNIKVKPNLEEKVNKLLELLNLSDQSLMAFEAPYIEGKE